MTVAAAADAAPAPSDAPPKSPEHNRLGLDFRRPMPRPKVRGVVIDWHTHLLAKRHTPAWFAAADHYGFDKFVTMTRWRRPSRSIAIGQIDCTSLRSRAGRKPGRSGPTSGSGASN